MPITDKQRAERIGYLGSSDAPAVLGISRYATPLSVWATKTGNYVEPDISGELRVKLGNRMEPIVAELFEEETGKKVQRVNETILHKQYPFLAANIDRRVIGENAILEIKTTAAWRKEEWSGENIPAEALCQVYHQLAVTGMKKAYLCALVGNERIEIRTVERDEKLLKELVEKEVAFWWFVETNTMPGVVSARDSDVIYALFPEAKPVTLTLGDDVAALAESRAAMIADVKALESQIDKTENELKIKLGDAEAATAGTYLLTWKNQTQERIDVKRLREEQPAVAELFVVEKKFRKLSIREAKK